MEPKRTAGRPRLFEQNVVRKTISLSPRHLEKARLIGEGNASRGIQRAIDRASLPPQAPESDAPASPGASPDGIALPPVSP